MPVGGRDERRSWGHSVSNRQNTIGITITITITITIIVILMAMRLFAIKDPNKNME